MEKNILILSGDGIGVEVCREAEKVINAVSKKYNIKFNLSRGLIGGIAYDETGSPFPVETLELAKKSDAILLGAVGGYKWDNIDFKFRPERGLLAIRKELELFANLRPAIVFEELADSSSLKREIVENLDIMIVRELTGGIYFGEPKGVNIKEDGSKEGYNTERYADYEIQRIAKVAFDIAKKRGKKLCSVDKANVLESSGLWREEVSKIGSDEYKDIELSHMYVDNASMQLVRNPKQFDVVVTTNMFGDILSDTASMLTGSLGMLPSASLGRKREDGGQYALYEPVHGSAPDIAGKNIANPIATILSFGMMLKYSFDRSDISADLDNAIKSVLKQGYRTADIMDNKSQKVSTSEMGDLIVKNLIK